MKTWYTRYAAIMLISTVALGAYQWISWSRLTPSDWGTWLSAIGTIGALFGTIHLARTETRRRERNERTIARLHGASMSPRIEDALIAVTKSAFMLNLARAGDRDPAFYGQCATTLAEIELWSIDEVTR